MKSLIFSSVALAALSGSALAAITGNPVADGWSFSGNSLANGTYVRGEGTFSFDIYSSAFTVQAGSGLVISDGAYSWLAGDQVLALGGKFVPTTASAAGWSSFSPNPYSGGGVAVNDDVSGSARLVSKFGTSTNTFSTSTTAPFLNGNGNGSIESGQGGDGALLLRTTSNRSAGGAGLIGMLDVATRYDGVGTPSSLDPRVGRMAYTWSNAIYSAGAIDTWEIMVNVSLLARVSSYGAYPVAGDDAIMAVQRSTNRYTDGLVTVTPAPGALALAGLGGLVVLRRRR